MAKGSKLDLMFQETRANFGEGDEDNQEVVRRVRRDALVDIGIRPEEQAFDFRDRWCGKKGCDLVEHDDADQDVEDLLEVVGIERRIRVMANLVDGVAAEGRKVGARKGLVQTALLAAGERVIAHPHQLRDAG
jgi:hypothetical protein